MVLLGLCECGRVRLHAVQLQTHLAAHACDDGTASGDAGDFDAPGAGQPIRDGAEGRACAGFRPQRGIYRAARVRLAPGRLPSVGARAGT